MKKHQQDAASRLSIIEAGVRPTGYLEELFKYRELLYFLAWRDVLVRYKQTAIGIVWAVLRPIVTLVIFTFVFSRVAALPSEGAAPYALLVLTGLLPWQFFSNGFSEAGSSLVDNERMVTKVYFPRVLIPLSTLGVCLVDFIISLVLLSVVFLWYGFAPDWRIAFLPTALLLLVVAALGPGLLIASLNVKYRDFRYVVPFMLQVGLYASPVGYSASLVPEHLKILYYLNPMAGIIDFFRWTMLAGEFKAEWPHIALSALMAGLLLLIGMKYFRATERHFADVI